MADPKQGTAFVMYVTLVDRLDPTQFVSNPTIVAGDFKISVDGGAFSNLATLPVVAPGVSRAVKVSLSASEMAGDNINIQGVDASDDEWGDVMITLTLPTSVNDDVFDILEGDHVETSTSLRINKKDTVTALVLKDITGSLLSPSVTVTTSEP